MIPATLVDTVSYVISKEEGILNIIDVTDDLHLVLIF